MTIYDPLNVVNVLYAFMTSSLDYVWDHYRPAGVSMRELFDRCLDYSSGYDMDKLVSKVLGLTRIQDTYSTTVETDVQLRKRAKEYLYILDIYDNNRWKTEGFSVSGSCSHSWAMYNGLYEQFQYCERCNEKRT